MNISISFTLNGVEQEIHPTVITTLIIVLFLSIMAVVINKKLKKVDFRENPKGLLLIAEIFVESIEKLTTEVMGKKNLYFAPYIGTLALFLAIANLSGLLGFAPPTSDYNVTLALSIMTFVMIHYNNIKFNGIKSYLKGFFEPLPLLFPINLLGDIATPVSLSFRLFGNILSGVIIMSLLYSGLSAISVFLIPFVAPVFHAYFDVFSGLLQTFIFIMLTMVFVAGAIGEDE